MPLTAQQKEDHLYKHVPHRLCLLVTFRDRQSWFRQRVSGKDNDLLRVSKDSALIAIRQFANFLGLQLENGKLTPCKPTGDDVSVDMLGGESVDLTKLASSDKSILVGLLKRGNKELAHLTSNYGNHDKFNKAEALIHGITLVESLLRHQLYDKLKLSFPNLEAEKLLRFDEWNFPDGPSSSATFLK
jgi:hypothetical protein